MAINPNITKEQTLEFLNSLEVKSILDSIFEVQEEYVSRYEKDIKSITKNVVIVNNISDENFALGNNSFELFESKEVINVTKYKADAA